MRASREVKALHHKEIVSTASRMLRGRGLDRTSVMDLMRAAGLTNGGFYRHFKSKDELVAESTRDIFGAIVATFQARSEKGGPRAALCAYVDEYLAGGHVNAPEEGCPIAAYGAEAARESDAVRGAFAEGLDQMLSLAAEGMPGLKEQRRARAAELLALMTGAVVMARAAGNPKLSQEILGSARQRAKRMIEERR
jgi:TetR/AcrR family transcriptional regulator, transcriptional repressor for nem operon